MNVRRVCFRLVRRLRIRLVRMAELIQVRLSGDTCLNITQSDDRSGYMDSPCQLVKRALRLTFYPHAQAVVSIGDAGDIKGPPSIGNAIQRGIERDHYRAHLRMNIAEDIRYADAGKDHAAG